MRLIDLVKLPSSGSGIALCGCTQQLKIMNYQWFIGLDVSKSKLDVVVMNPSAVVVMGEEVANTKKELNKFLRKLRKSCNGPALFCLEATGGYSNEAVRVLYQAKEDVWVANGADVKSSIGLQRGKNDSVDAKRIADFARRHNDRKRLVTASFIRTMALRDLVSMRDYFVKERSSLLKRNQQIELGASELRSFAKQVHQRAILQVSTHIKLIDQKITEFIENSGDMRQQFMLMISVVGIGPIIAASLLAYTHGMTAYNNPRHLASYMGVAPFEHRSGSSIRGRTRVSYKANKGLKKLLHLSALSAIKNDEQIKAYYERKVKEGKHKMAVLNAVRNKIIHRLCAVLDRQTPYIKDLQVS